MSLLIRNIDTLYQVRTGHTPILRGQDMAELPVLRHAWVLADNGHIAGFGTMDTCPERADKVIDATGRHVFPAWVDSHTHIVFARGREEEFVSRIKGETYETIAAKGGGILNSAHRLQAMSESELLEGARQRLYDVIGMGTGCIEIKSGYGLTVESELKMLRVIRALKAESPIPIKATFLGAHAIPAAFKTHRQGYINQIIDEMLPKVAGEGLADYCDVFCDRGYFTPEETDQILKAALKYNLPAKIHANELGYTGGVQVGVANNAISVDHLEYTGDEEIKALSSSKTLPVLLPSCAFFLGIPYAPARKMIDAGLPVVLASDYNPGSSPSGNIPLVMSLACIKMKMLPEEAINAVTINAAHALESEKVVGSISVGKIANMVISKPISSLAYLPYAFGSNLVERVIIKGSIQQMISNNNG